MAAPAPEPPPAPVAAPEPKPEPPAAPVGPFFEQRDVNEAPRVATRVEPQVPDELRGQLNEVVIVRVLVTQAGHPLMVNLLRKSKAGASLDNAIVAAVKQWTFVPARKRGEAVSCWYHLGVPVSRANHVFIRGASPLGLPDTLSRAPLRRRAVAYTRRRDAHRQ